MKILLSNTHSPFTRVKNLNALKNIYLKKRYFCCTVWVLIIRLNVTWFLNNKFIGIFLVAIQFVSISLWFLFVFHALCIIISFIYLNQINHGSMILFKTLCMATLILEKSTQIYFVSIVHIFVQRSFIKLDFRAPLL